MSMYDYRVCTCGFYHSIIPPAPCPIHANSFTWTTTTSGGRSCTGRHCRHDANCYRGAGPHHYGNV